MHLPSGCCMTRCFRSIRNRVFRRLSMASTYFDRIVGIRKVKRAEATLLGRTSGDLSELKSSELLECAWALSTMLVAAQQGLRLAPEIFALAESVAHSLNAAPFASFSDVIVMASPA